MKIKASIVGAAGYTGTELIRILTAHPHVEISRLTSRRHENTPLEEVFPRLAGSEAGALALTNTDHATVARDSDVVFLCLPHETTQDAVPDFLGKTKIIDLSADFRLRDPEAYARYYSSAHKRPELLDGRFVYGLPELFREKIKGADLIANPGCYAQLIQLMLYPFKDHIERASVMAVSGMSGAGRAPVDPALFPPASQSLQSYKINKHRHRPEILQTLELNEERFDFVPTVGPFMRGIFATAFVEADTPPAIPAGYGASPFLRVKESDVQLANVVSTNFADLSFHAGKADGTYIVQGAFDNLLKGAAGTAVQNMNLMFGAEESEGLRFTTPLYP